MSTTAAPAQANQAIIFSAARVRQVFDSKGLNDTVNKHLEPHKAIVNKHKACEQAIQSRKVTVKITTGPDGQPLEKAIKEDRVLTAEEVAKYESEIKDLAPKLDGAKQMVAILSREKIRFANAAAPALAVVCEELIKELLVGAMQVVKATEMKIVYLKHIFQSTQQTKYHQLYSQLPAFANRKALYEAEQLAKRTQKNLEDALALAKKDWIKEKGLQPERKREAPPKNPAAKAEKAKAAEVITPASGVSFKVYVGHLIDFLKKEEANKNIRFSDEIRIFLSEVALEFIQRISNKVHLDISSRKNKTITPAVIMRAVETIMNEGHIAQTELIYSEGMKPDPKQIKAKMTAEEIAALPQVLCKEFKRKTTYLGSNYSELHCAVVSALVASGHKKEALGL